MTPEELDQRITELENRLSQHTNDGLNSPQVSYSDLLNKPAATTDATLSTSDITTNNVSTSKHGFAPKGDGSGASFLNGLGAYSAVSVVPNWVDEGSLNWSASTSDQTLSLANTGKDLYMVVVNLNFTDNVINTCNLRFNSDSTNNYRTMQETWNPGSSASIADGGNSSQMLVMNNASSRCTLNGVLFIRGTPQATNVNIGVTGSLNSTGNISSVGILRQGAWNNATANLSTITFMIGGNHVTGRIHVYSLNL